MKNSKIQNGRHFWRDKNFFQTWDNYFAEIPCGSKISSKSLYLVRFRDISIFMFAIFVKNSKIQNGRHFWRDKTFFKNGITTPQRYPVGQKFRRNRSI